LKKGVLTQIVGMCWYNVALTGYE